MMKPIQKMDEMRTVAGYNKGFWTLVVALVFASICLIHIETSRAKPNELISGSSPVTVERIPSSEARKMGVEPRNN